MLSPVPHIQPLRVPGLPTAASTPRSPSIGATSTNLTVPDEVADVSGQPSMKMARMDGGGVATLIRRNTRYTGIIDERDLEGLRRLMAAMVRQAENQSQGPLTLRRLRAMGHPYGRGADNRMRGKTGRIGRVKGARGSVSDLAVTNRQSGELGRSWRGGVELDAGGVTLSLMNVAPHSEFPAFGTARMQAHGPNTNVPARMLSQINSEWQRIVRQAARRKSIEAMVARSLGM